MKRSLVCTDMSPPKVIGTGWTHVNPHLIHEVNFNLFELYRERVRVQGQHFQHLL
jgi:hypothetical protein